MTIYVEATLTDNEELLNDNRLVPFITSMLSLTLAMNALTTCTSYGGVRTLLLTNTATI